MSWQVAKRALDIVCQDGEFCTIQFAGGEPLLNIDLIEQIVQYTTNWNVRYQLQTNATLIDRTNSKWLKERRIGVGISLDGIPAINDVLRPFSDGSGSTLAVVAGLSNLAAQKLRVGLTCVISEASATGLVSLIDFVSYLGIVEGISLDVMRPTGRAFDGTVEPASPTTLARILPDALAYADGLARVGVSRVRFREIERLRYTLTKEVNRFHHCHFDACSALMVHPTGEAFPCASLAGSAKFSLGSVLDDGFEDYLQARLSAARGIIDDPRDCITCKDRLFCGGRCKAQVYYQDPHATSSDCLIKRIFACYVRGQSPTHPEYGVSNSVQRKKSLSV
jgi:uncharacterized protein